MCRSGIAVLMGAALCTPVMAGQAESGRAEAPDQDFQAAVTLYNSGQYPEAVRELERLVQHYPASFKVHELLGLAYSAETNDRQANLNFEEAVRLKPGSAVARANLGINLARLGQKDRAEAEFKKAIQIEPGSFETNHDLGEFYANSGKVSAAVPYLKKAQMIDPSSYVNGYDLALAYEQTHDLSLAREQIRELLAHQDAAELHNLLGEIEERAGNYVPAANEFQRATEMDPSESNIFDWGSELLVHRTLEPAAEVFSRGLKRYPDSPRLAVGLGLALYQRGSYDDAVKAFLRATDLTPADSRAYYFLSQAYDSSPNQAEAVIQHFRRFAELQPENARAFYYYAMAIWKGKETEASDADLKQIGRLLQKALSLDPALTEAHLQLGNLYSHGRKYAEAIPEYERALKLDPNLPDAHYRLGQAYTHVGDRDRAQREFQIHQQLYQKQLAESDKYQEEIQQFVYSVKGNPAKP
jgi:tetratricopeptide (TPR) repeat protein